jgi:hypothetical protein
LSREQNHHSARVLKHERIAILEYPAVRQMWPAMVLMTGAKSAVRDRLDGAEELRLLPHI